MIKKLYPNGKPKAFNITYDDGVEQDVRFVELLNSYGLKGTFNLNSRLMEEEFQWQHEKGLTIKRLPPETVRLLYEGHEVASHSLTHPYMHGLNEGAVMYELGQDKKNLQQLFKREISGFAVPFDYYSELIARCAKNCGFEYARHSQSSYSYRPPEDYFWWTAGVFHLNPGFMSFVEGFFETDEELALCQIVGHSYDLDAEDMWETMEHILKRAAEDESIAPMTNLELVRYLKAMRAADIWDGFIQNNSGMELWFEADGEIISVPPYSRY